MQAQGQLIAASRALAPLRGGMVKPVRVLICGIPNVGKSTLINTLKGKRAAKTGDEAGVTKQEMRIALKWKPTSALTFTPSLYYQVVDAKDISAFNLELPNYQAQKQVREPSRDTLVTPSVTINWDMGGADLTSSTSYFQRKFDRTQNGSAYNSYSLSTFLTSTEDGGKAPPELIEAIAGLPSAVYLNNQVRQVSQEFRVASDVAARADSIGSVDPICTTFCCPVTSAAWRRAPFARSDRIAMIGRMRSSSSGTPRGSRKSSARSRMNMTRKRRRCSSEP